MVSDLLVNISDLLFHQVFQAETYILAQNSNTSQGVVDSTLVLVLINICKRACGSFAGSYHSPAGIVHVRDRNASIAVDFLYIHYMVAALTYGSGSWCRSGRNPHRPGTGYPAYGVAHLVRQVRPSLLGVPCAIAVSI